MHWNFLQEQTEHVHAVNVHFWRICKYSGTLRYSSRIIESNESKSNSENMTTLEND